MGSHKIIRLGFLIPMILLGMISIGCGGGGHGLTDPGVTRDNSLAITTQNNPSQSYNGTVLWGLWDISGDPSTGELTITPLRTADFQANVTRYLQPPISPKNQLGIVIDKMASDFATGLVICDVTVHHPFPGTKFWGFDVRGIIMGSPAGEVELLNCDGYTRWWNPAEFTTVGTLFGYTEGKFAQPGPTPTTILHPYKYFADSLGAEDALVINPATRGVMNPDNPGFATRKYEIQFPAPGGIPDFHFKYAITASWKGPDGTPPYDLSDFPIEANQPEAYQLSVLDMGSTLYSEGASSGGDLKMKITVYDWQKPYNPDGMAGEIASLKVECDPIGLALTDILPTATVLPGTDMNSVSYEFTIAKLSPVAPGPTQLWVTAESANVTTYAPDIPGITGFAYPEDAVLSAYNRVTINVSDTAPPDEPKTIHLSIPNGGEVWEIETDHDITWESTGPITEVKIEYSLSGTDPWIEIVPSTENDGVYEWPVPDSPTETARVRVSDVDDANVKDISDGDFTIAPHDVYIYVDDSSISPDEYGTMADPYKTITKAIDSAAAGKIILVDDSGNEYAESVVLTDGITVQSQNWDIADGGPRAGIRTPDIPGASSVSADGVTGATIAGFDIHPGGSYTPDYWGWVTFVALANSSEIKISNCHLNGEEMERSFYGIFVTACSDIEIANCHIEHLHGPEPLSEYLNEWDTCIYAENTPGMYIHNVRMNHLGVNFNEGGHIVDSVRLYSCADAVMHNNVVYRIQVSSDGQGAALVTGFSLELCDHPTFYNNTVNFLDTEDNFFINQAFCYFLNECSNGVFYNNIATNVTESGWAPDGSSLGRGIQSYLYDLPCDYTLTWNIEQPYFQSAFPNVGCVEAQPMFIDPENGLHDIDLTSEGQLGDPSFVDWDDTGAPSNDPDNPDPNTRSRIGCHGGPNGASVGIVN